MWGRRKKIAGLHPHLLVYVCTHVLEGTKPVLYVPRPDGDFCFLCGDDHDEDVFVRVAGLRHVIDQDPTLVEVLDLPDDVEAERTEVGGPWKRSPVDPD